MKVPSKIELYKHQTDAVEKLRTGSILCGGVGSGKSLASIAYYQKKVPPWQRLYVITTARKRDTLDWEQECKHLDIVPEVVDSWNNIKKYVDIDDAFFIFDEQRVVGSGVWVKSFLKICKKNDWILLTATPGDTWMDYLPVFIANRFYKNRTQFIRRHVIFNRFLKFPKVERYIETDRLEKLKRHVTVTMDYKNPTTSIYEDISVEYDKVKLDLVVKKRWNPFIEEPIRDIAQTIFVGRRVVNSDPSRLGTIQALIGKHRKLIVFYNFNYELDILRELNSYPDITVAEYNGHKHEAIPIGDKWVYLVQYMSGSEAWNCTETNTIVFYSLNYSYRMMTQAAGRVDRMNTPFAKLYYYRLISDTSIDRAVKKALSNKKNFNEKRFARNTYPIIEGE